MRQQLGQICNAPLEEMIKKTRDDLDLKALRSAGRALLKDKQNKIPDERRKELTEIILNYFQKDELTDDDLQKSADIDPKLENDNYISHAEIVVKYFSENDGILKLEKMWRQHFLDYMKPQFLPPNWSVDHQESRLIIRKEENRIHPDDYDLAQGKP